VRRQEARRANAPSGDQIAAGSLWNPEHRLVQSLQGCLRGLRHRLFERVTPERGLICFPYHIDGHAPRD